MKIRNRIVTVLVIIILCTPYFSTEVFALTNEQKENSDKIGGFLVSELGLKTYVAFGILGNIYQESGCNPAAMNPNGASGICQWMGGRKTKMVQEAGSNWKSNLDGQLRHLKNELEGSYKKVYNKLKELPDTKEGMEKAAEIWCKEFEICGNYGSEVPRRIKHAEMLYKELDGKLSGYSAGSGSEAYDFSIIQEFLAPITSIKLTDGSLLSTTTEEKEHRRKINEKILHNTVKGSSGKTYSLYERFGPKLQFIEYCGEVSENIEVGDHIISAYATENDKDIKITDDILKYEPHVYLSTQVYKNRPPVLDAKMLKQGYMDTRAQLYKDGNVGKLYALSLAKRRLAVSTFIVGTVNLFTDNKFFVFILGIFKTIVTSDAWKIVKVGITSIGFIFIAAFIFSLIRHAIRFAVGKEPASNFFTRFAIGVFAIGLVALFLSSPANMLDKSSRVVNGIDDLVNEGLSATFKDDPAIYSSDGKYTMNAAIWNTALFEPWCKALFGKPYNKLYTQYATKTSNGKSVSKNQKLDQSYEPDHENPQNNEFDDLFYDSAGHTGDVGVDLGAKEKEKNWAAYALSTMSIYHISHDVYEDEKDVTNINHFPNALTTFRNKNLYADTFRWIDAKMNISPQYYIEDGESFNNYGDSRGFETHYYKYSWEMLWNAILLAMLLPVIWFRLKAFLNIMYIAIKGIYYSLVELIKENTGLSSFWADIKDNILKYAYHSIQLYILLFLYTTLIGKTNFMFDAIYIALCFVISATSPRDIYNKGRHIKKDIQAITMK